jgi:hypothetical protein
MNADVQWTTRATQRRLSVGLCAMALVVLCSLPAQARYQITAEQYLCPNNQQRHYVMNLDGDYFHVYFTSAASGRRSYVQDAYGRTYNIRFGPTTSLVDPQPQNQQDVIEGRTGPGYIGVDWDYRHRLVFWVDFQRTPSDVSDDQRFDGYLMTQTETVFAGIAWKNGIPVPFSASFHHCI